MIAGLHNLMGLPFVAENIFQSRSDKTKLEIGRRSKSGGMLSMTQISPEVFPQEAKVKPLCGG